MKKLLFLGVLMFALVGGVFCLASPKTVCYAETTVETTTETELPAETEEGNYFREVVMPYITANISGILSAALAIVVMLGKLKAATDELKSSNSINNTLKKENSTLRTDVKSLQTELAEVKDDLKATKEMVKIGFCNTAELVENGYAAEIARVGENEKEEE